MHEFCNSDLDKFFLLLTKGIYPLYSELNLEGIGDADYEYAKKSMGSIRNKKSW